MGDVVERYAQRDVGNREGDSAIGNTSSQRRSRRGWRRCSVHTGQTRNTRIDGRWWQGLRDSHGQSGVEFQDDIDPRLGFINWVQFLALLRQVIHCLADGCILEFEPGNDRPFEFFLKSVDFARIPFLRHKVAQRRVDIEFPHRIRPRLGHALQVAPPCFEGTDGMKITLGLADFLHQHPRGLVVRVDIQDSFAPLEGDVVAIGFEVALGLDEELFDILHVFAVAWPDGLVVVIGIFEVGEDENGLPAARVVALVGDDAQRAFGVLVAAFGDALFGQPAARRAKAPERPVIGRPGEFGVWDKIAGKLVARRGLFVVADLHGRIRVFEHLLAPPMIVLTTQQLLLRGALNATLGEGKRRSNDHRRGEERGDSGSERGSGHGCDRLVGCDWSKFAPGRPGAAWELRG